MTLKFYLDDDSSFFNFSVAEFNSGPDPANVNSKCSPRDESISASSIKRLMRVNPRIPASADEILAIYRAAF